MILVGSSSFQSLPVTRTTSNLSLIPTGFRLMAYFPSPRMTLADLFNSTSTIRPGTRASSIHPRDQTKHSHFARTNTSFLSRAATALSRSSRHLTAKRRASSHKGHIPPASDTPSRQFQRALTTTTTTSLHRSYQPIFHRAAALSHAHDH